MVIARPSFLMSSSDVGPVPPAAKYATSPTPGTAVTCAPAIPWRPYGIWPTVFGPVAAIVAPALEALFCQVHDGALTPAGTPAPTVDPRAALTSAGVTSAQS